MSNILLRGNNLTEDIYDFELYEYKLHLRRYNGEIHVITVEVGPVESELYRSSSFDKSSKMFDRVAESIKRLVEDQKTQAGIN